jgi:hypothetical protein
MALPVLDKTWQFNVNNQLNTTGLTPNDNAQVLLLIKNALIGFGSNAWSVISSSNSLVANSSDNWNAIADIVWQSSGNPHSWIILRQTGIATNYEICIDCVNYLNGTRLSVLSSPSIGFVGGSTTIRPTASDEISLLYQNVYFGNAALFDARIHIMQSTDGQCTRIIGFNTHKPGGPYLLWVFDKVKDPVSGWQNPSISSVYGLGSTAASYARLFDNNDYCWGHENGSFGLYMTSEQVDDESGALGEIITFANDIDETYPMIPVGLHSKDGGNRGRHGVVYDLWWGLTVVPTLTTYPANASKQFVQFEDLIFPWNGSIPIGY